MLPKKKHLPTVKSGLHPRNKHKERYDFPALIRSCAELAPFVKPTAYKDLAIDFSNPQAVLLLNKALLKHYYFIDYWSIPAGYLCPPIPGRADYIHHLADLLGSCNKGSIPTGIKIKCLDIGTGANCIYPIIGHQEYGWSFVGSDVEPTAIKSAVSIIESNASLRGNVELRLQKKSTDIFRGIFGKEERFDLTLCNPPFHASLQEAQAGTLRKLSNLQGKRVTKAMLNFGGTHKELWCEGGEEKFILAMIAQSKEFSTSCFWFSTLVSKSSHLKTVYAALHAAKAVDVRTINMSQGNKTSRFVAWTYLTTEQQSTWVSTRWNKRV